MFLQEYTPEEDSTRKLIEAHFRGKPMDINFDKDKGEIVITYKNLNKEPSLMQLLVCRQMINIYMRYLSIISFCFSSVAPIFFTNKINRMLLEYLYSDGLVVRTTIDTRLQKAANQAVARQLQQLQVL